MPGISVQAAEEYIEHGGRTCPWCKKGNVVNDGEMEWQHDTIAIPVKCDNVECGIKWDNIFVLHDLNEDACRYKYNGGYYRTIGEVYSVVMSDHPELTRDTLSDFIDSHVEEE